MGITLYHCLGSPPSHAVRLAAKYLGVELELKEVDLEKGEQLTPEFLKVKSIIIYQSLLSVLSNVSKSKISGLYNIKYLVF